MMQTHSQHLFLTFFYWLCPMHISSSVVQSSSFSSKFSSITSVESGKSSTKIISSDFPFLPGPDSLHPPTGSRLLPGGKFLDLLPYFFQPLYFSRLSYIEFLDSRHRDMFALFLSFSFFFLALNSVLMMRLLLERYIAIYFLLTPIASSYILVNIHVSITS